MKALELSSGAEQFAGGEGPWDYLEEHVQRQVFSESGGAAELESRLSSRSEAVTGSQLTDAGHVGQKRCPTVRAGGPKELYSG